MSAWWWLLWAPTFMSLLALAVGRMLRDPHGSERDRIIREANARVGLIPAAPDNEPGVSVAAQDACELIWSMPSHEPDDAELDEACGRLRDAIDEHRKENPS